MMSIVAGAQKEQKPSAQVRARGEQCPAAAGKP